MAGVPDGDPPAGTTKTWNDGPAAGAGAQEKAQPIFHGAAVVVNDVLVQLPLSCGEVRSTRAGPAAAAGAEVGVEVDPPATVVVVTPAAVVVVVVAPLELPTAAPALAVPPLGAVVVVAAVEPEDDALGGGSLPLLALVPPVPDAPPVSPLIHIPRMAANRTAVRSCHVFQERRSLIFSSPGFGVSSDAIGGPSGSTGTDVTGSASNKLARWSTHHPLAACSSTREPKRQVEVTFEPAAMMDARFAWALIS